MLWNTSKNCGALPTSHWWAITTSQRSNGMSTQWAFYSCQVCLCNTGCIPVWTHNQINQRPGEEPSILDLVFSNEEYTVDMVGKCKHKLERDQDWNIKGSKRTCSSQESETQEEQTPWWNKKMLRTVQRKYELYKRYKRSGITKHISEEWDKSDKHRPTKWN